MEIISRAEAIARGLKRYFTGRPCKFGHISECQIANYTCCECDLQKKMARYYSNLEQSREQRRTYYADNLDRIKENSRRSRLNNREAILAGKKAYYDRIKLDPGWQEKQKAIREASKAAKRIYDREYRSREPLKWTERAKEWRKANPEKRRAIIFTYDSRRRAQKRQGDSTAVVRQWAAAAPKVCHWCGAKCAHEYHIDHYEPLSKGGEHVTANLVIACPRCNLKKNAKDPYEFAASVGRLF